MLCDSTKTPRRLYGDCAETALRIDSQWSRSQIRQSMRAALLNITLYNLNCLLVRCKFLTFGEKTQREHFAILRKSAFCFPLLRRLCFPCLYLVSNTRFTAFSFLRILDC